MMKRRILFLVLIAGCAGPLSGQAAKFSWPEGKRAAVSLTFDDGRPSQIDTGLPLLAKLGIRATFYVLPGNVEKRLDGWKKAVQAGHEIGNHSMTHPCTANYAFSRANALEDYDLERIAKDIDAAQQAIARMLGVTPASFAYPCGQSFVGRGRAARSYVPLVAERFVLGRGYMGEAANDVAVFDAAQAMGTPFDDMAPGDALKLLEAAAKDGRWIIFVGHDIGPRKFQSVDAATIEAIAAYAKDPANGIWLEPAGAVARYIASRR
ncbi:MAG: polysaccharide deacetylase family protein [Bryobacteraceae bacterium]|nr:polysaccharide deacetylase family protein [Bryobacteraceae bacterium]MCX7605595.1 polysaccharide deacetylase family protein [Bryobacteraceae bacterium]